MNLLLTRASLVRRILTAPLLWHARLSALLEYFLPSTIAAACDLIVELALIAFLFVLGLVFLVDPLHALIRAL